MRHYNNVILLQERTNIEQLHINLANKGLKASLAAFKFIDKDTKQHVFYLQSLNLSGYGETTNKAWEMLKFTISDFFIHLLSLQNDERENILSSGGWEKSRLFNEELYSLCIDKNEPLQKFNAETVSILLTTILIKQYVPNHNLRRHPIR